MKKRLWLLPIVAAVALPVQAVAQIGRGAQPVYDEIREYRLAAHVKFLADDLLEGRAPATRGGEIAARYIATQFELLGLEPGAPDGTFFQPVEIVESVVDPSFQLRATAGTTAERTYDYLTDVMAFSDLHDERLDTRGELVFVGHGIVAPEYRWNDYEGADVEGKVVLVMVNDPPATPEEPELFGGRALTYYGRWTYKFEEAARQGAAGAILIHTPESATYGWEVVRSSWSGSQFSLPPVPGGPALALKAWVTDDTARSLAALGGHDLDALRAAALERGARAVPLGVTVAGAITQQVSRQHSPNVIGVLRGINESQAVVYTAHYDHLGMRDANGRVIYNGARDNASGVAGIVEIARAFVDAPSPPGRPIYFVATAAEESGLLGAEYMAANPPLPIDAFAANVNVDSLNIWGRTRDIVLLGAERSTLGAVIDQIAEERNRQPKPDPEPERGYFFRSDHFPFAKMGVPAVSISDSTDFIGPDAALAAQRREEHQAKHYHQPTDVYTPEWDLSGAVEDLQFLAELGWRVAADPIMPAYHPDDQFARPRQASHVD